MPRFPEPLRVEGLKLDFGSTFKLVSMATGEGWRKGSQVQQEICFPGGGVDGLSSHFLHYSFLVATLCISVG